MLPQRSKRAAAIASVNDTWVAPCDLARANRSNGHENMVKPTRSRLACPVGSAAEPISKRKACGDLGGEAGLGEGVDMAESLRRRFVPSGSEAVNSA